MFSRITKKLIVGVVVLSILLCNVFGVVVTAKDGDYIDNSDLLPKYVSDEYVNLEKSDKEGLLMTPSWFKTAIIVQARLDNASTDGTIEGAIDMLDHYAETGINCIMLNPVSARCANEKGELTNFYTNAGPHTIDSALTGTNDYEEGWEKFAWFVRQAHKRNIRIILDFTIWGVSKYADLPKEHPEYFERNEDNTDFVESKWGGPAFNTESQEFREFYKNTIVDIAEKTNLDGLRLDLEPNISGYDFWTEIRNEALNRGKKLVLISEAPNERKGAYDASQFGVVDFENGWSYTRQLLETDHKYYLDYYNPVESIKTGQCIGDELSQMTDESGTHRFYTYGLSFHDDGSTNINQNLLVVGYQAMFTPFIPIWCMGEELGIKISGQLYEKARIDRTVLNNSENREFYETLKKYIRIRRTYTDIFEYYPLNHRESNICEVQVAGLEKYQAYARYDDKGNAIIIVPNGNSINKDGKMTVSIPFAEMGMQHFTKCKVTDLLNNKVLVEGTSQECGNFDVTVEYQELGIYFVEVDNKKDAQIVEKEVGDGTPDSVTTTTIFSPINKNKTIKEVINIIEENWLSPIFWIALSVCVVVIIVAGVLLTIYIIKQRKKRRL